MDKTLDLRVQKTYEALIQAFFEIVQEKSMDKLTVNELCQKAQVRRPTFYKHFKDKYDFFKFAVYSIQKDTLLEVDTEADISQPVDYFLTCFTKVLGLLEEYQKVLFHFKFNSIDQFPLNIVDNYLDSQIKKRVTYFIKQDPRLPQDAEFTCQMLIGLFRQGALWWLKSKRNTSKKEALELMKKFLLLIFPGQENSLNDHDKF